MIEFSYANSGSVLERRRKILKCSVLVFSEIQEINIDVVYRVKR